MAIKFIDRASQLNTFGVKFFNANSNINDEIFDGVDVPRATYARHWKLEMDLHQTFMVSEKIATTRNFLGQQHNMIRDEIRRKTWGAYIEKGGKLVLLEITNSGIISKTTIIKKGAWRSHLALEKYTGKIFVTAILIKNGEKHIWFDGNIIETDAEEPDFPFFEFNSVAIGHVPDKSASYGLFTYKCRKSNQLYTRHYLSGTLGKEFVFNSPPILGGAGLAISGNNVVMRVDEIKDNVITPLVYKSKDSGENFDKPESIDVPYDKSFKFMPASAPPTKDFAGAFHIPVAMSDANESIGLDWVMDVALVEAIRKPGNFKMADRMTINAFPKTICNASISDKLRFGDGITDGIGVITSLQTDGKLYTSNSQSGGVSYPESGYINHEMPLITAYDATECHTTGEIPNTVSMDYIYLEASHDGVPLGRQLHFETWDMPLPIPTINAVSDMGVVTVTIEKNANFVNGKTTFEFDDPMIAITGVEITGTRKAILSTDADDLKGKTITFEARSILYHHKASAIIT